MTHTKISDDTFAGGGRQSAPVREIEWRICGRRVEMLRFVRGALHLLLRPSYLRTTSILLKPYILNTSAERDSLKADVHKILWLLMLRFYGGGVEQRSFAHTVRPLGAVPLPLRDEERKTKCKQTTHTIRAQSRWHGFCFVVLRRRRSRLGAAILLRNFLGCVGRKMTRIFAHRGLGESWRTCQPRCSRQKYQA